MPTYRRLFIPGGTYFFTVAAAARGTSLLVDEVDTLRQVFAETRDEHHFTLYAIVILPDHLHTVMTLSPGDADFPLIWNKIKGRFSRRLGVSLPRSRSKIAKRERGLWQRRYWEHLIRDETDFRRHIEYCWVNPVKHGLVQSTADWRWSSYQRDVRRGIAPAEFGGRFPDGTFGEPVRVR